MTFLVTGAAGNIGALAVEALLDRGVATRAASGESFLDVLPILWDVVPGHT